MAEKHAPKGASGNNDHWNHTANSSRSIDDPYTDDSIRNTRASSLAYCGKPGRDNVPSTAQTDFDLSDIKHTLTFIRRIENDDVGPEILRSNLSLALRIVESLQNKASALAAQLQSELITNNELKTKLQNLLQCQGISEAMQNERTLLPRNYNQTDAHSQISHSYLEVQRILTSFANNTNFNLVQQNVVLFCLNELSDQLANFVKINDSLKESCDQRIGNMKTIILNIETQKKEFCEQISNELDRIATLPTADAAAVHSLSQRILSLSKKEQTEVATLIHEESRQEIEHMRRRQENFEKERKELLQVISKQQDAIKMLEEEVASNETNRQNDATIPKSSLRKSLSNVQIQLDPKNAHSSQSNENVDAISDEMLNYLESRKVHCEIIAHEIESADRQVAILDDRLAELKDFACLDRVSRDHKKPADVSKRGNFPTETIVQQQMVTISVLQKENSDLRKTISEQKSELLNKTLLIENLENAIKRAKFEVEELQSLSLDSVVADLQTRVAKEVNLRDEISRSTVAAKEDLLRMTSHLCAQNTDIMTKMEEEMQHRLKTKYENIHEIVADNSKLINRNLELGAQLSKLSSEYAQSLWSLRDTAKDRDILQAKLTELEIQYRALKQKNLKTKDVELNDWATQTDENLLNFFAQDAEENVQRLEIEVKTLQTQIETLRSELLASRKQSQTLSEENVCLRADLSGIRKEFEEIHESADQLLKGTAESLSESPRAIHLALLEARKVSDNLSEKLKKMERLDTNQKETISNLGSQLAQQSVKLGEAEWKLRQKDEDIGNIVRNLEAKIERLTSNIGSDARLDQNQPPASIIQNINGLLIPSLQTESPDGEPAVVETHSECEGCVKLHEKLAVLMSRLEKERVIAKAAKQAQISVDEEKNTLRNEILQLQKKLNEGMDDMEKLKRETEENLKSYNDLKNWVKLNKEVRKTTETSALPQIPIPMIIEPSLENQNLSQHPLESRQSAEQLALQLYSSSNTEMLYDASQREVKSLKEKLEKSERELANLQKELQELKVNEQTTIVATLQVQERSNLTNKIVQLQKELADQIVSKGLLEAELAVKSASDKRKLSLFKDRSPSTSNPSSPTKKFSFARSRTNSVKSAELPAPPMTLELRLIDERDKLAADLVTKSTEIASLTSEIANLSTKLSKTMEESQAKSDKHALAVAAFEDEIKGLTQSHAEIEECLQNQIQELSDQLMEPKPYQDMLIESRRASKGVPMEKMAVEKAKVRALESKLKEAQLQNDILRSKIDFFENEIDSIQSKSLIENYASTKIIDYAQSALENLTSTFSLNKNDENATARNKREASVEGALQGQKGEIVAHNDSFKSEEANVHAISQPSKTNVLHLVSKEANSSEVDDLSAKNAALLEKVEQLEKLKENLQKRSILLEAKIQELSAALTTKIDSFQLLMGEKTQLSNRIDTTMWKLQAVQERCAAAESRVLELEAKNRRSIASTGQIAECEGCAQLASAMKKLNQELVEYQLRCDKAAVDLTNIEWQKYALEAKLKTAESETFNLKQHNTARDETIKELKERLIEVESSIKTKENAFDFSRDETEIRFNATKKELDAAYSEICMLKATTQAKIIQLESFNTKLEIELNEERANNLKLEDKIRNMSVQITENYDKIDSLTSSISKMKETQLETDASHENEVEHLNAIISLSQQQYNGHAQEVSKYKNMIASLESQIRNPEAQVPSSNQIELDVCAQKDSATNHAKAEAILKAKDDIIADLEARLGHLSSEISYSKSENQALSEQLKKSNEKIDELIKSLIVRTTRLKGKEEWACELEQEITRLRTQLVRQTDDQFHQLQDGSYDSFLKEELDRAKTQIEELIKMSLDRSTLLKEKEDRISGLEEEVPKLSEQLKKAQASVSVLEGLLKDGEEKTASLEQLIAELKEAITIREEELVEVRKWLHESEEDLARKETELQTMSSQHALKQLQIETKGEKLLEVSDDSPTTAVSKNASDKVVPRIGAQLEDSLFESKNVDEKYILLTNNRLVPVSLFNLLDREIPHAWRLLAQAVCGISAVGLILRPRTRERTGLDADTKEEVDTVAQLTLSQS
ncbi:hypothetical protein HDU83_000550 [Entophlyctis luteolus]|nr:hypothetical protein HDU83_000550 [Entophlyctis luteolus]